MSGVRPSGQVNFHRDVRIREDHAPQRIRGRKRAVAEAGVVLVGSGAAVAALVFEVLDGTLGGSGISELER